MTVFDSQQLCGGGCGFFRSCTACACTGASARRESEWGLERLLLAVQRCCELAARFQPRRQIGRGGLRGSESVVLCLVLGSVMGRGVEVLLDLGESGVELVEPCYGSTRGG